MYPLARFTSAVIKARRMPKMALTDTHVSQHRCWPWDIDVWMELNNGRAMTLYDLGRTMISERTGLTPVLFKRKWGLAVVGSSVRFRRRIRTFERFEMRSRCVTWDDKFTYMEQSMWKQNGECASHVMFRTAATDKNGIVPPAELAKALDTDPTPPPMPDWMQAWCQADATRPWPPMQDGLV